VPRLILLNGPPAAGKSTLARRYADQHPLTLILDIDRIRAQLGGWRDDPGRSGLLAREIGVAAARTHLARGFDVVVPQLLARLEFIERLEALAAAAGARFREVFLLGDLDEIQARYRERGRIEAAADRPDAAVSTDRTDAELADTYNRLLRVLPARPSAVVIRTTAGEIDRAYSDLLTALR
jgi:predicted kinase